MSLLSIGSKLKGYALAIVAGALAVLGIAVRVLAGQNANLRAENKQAKKSRKQAVKVIKTDEAINEQEDIRLAETKKELKSGGSSELEDPNKW